jgi:parvulin-like peptidyl-prolyl isomerase
MSKRKKRVEDERELTRKELRLRARDRERNRRLYIGVGIAVGLAVLLVAVGAVLQYVVRPNSPIVTVGQEQIVTRDFWKRLRFEKVQLEGQLAQMQQLEAQFGQGMFGRQISQLQSTLASPASLALQVLDRMIDEKVVGQQAATRSITVSEEEIDNALREEIANSRGAVTEPQATSTGEAAGNATATAAGWTPTPTPTIDVSSTITATATPFPTPEPLPTRAIISETGFSEGMTQLTENLKSAGDLSLAEYRELIKARLLAEKMQEVIATEMVTTTEEQVHARHILINIQEPVPTPTTTLTTTTTLPLTSSTPLTNLLSLTTTSELTTTTALSETAGITSTADLTGTPALAPTVVHDKNAPLTDEQARTLAEELRQRLLNGEDFAKLSAEYSDDPGSGSNGGDLGWFGKGRMVKPFEDAAFSLPLNQVSEPIKSDFGYHLIEVLEKDTARQKDQGQLEQERSQAYQTWLQEQKTATQIDRPDDINALLPSDFR